MKHKHPPIPRSEPTNLVLSSVTADDPGLPRKSIFKAEPCASAGEILSTADKLAATRRFGGLLPDRSRGRGYWQCPVCHAVRGDRPSALICHEQPPNRVQICVHCLERDGSLERIGECHCRPRSAS